MMCACGEAATIELRWINSSIGTVTEKTTYRGCTDCARRMAQDLEHFPSHETLIIRRLDEDEINGPN